MQDSIVTAELSGCSLFMMRPLALSIQHPPYDQPAGRLVAVPVPVDLEVDMVVDMVVLGWVVDAVFELAEVVELLVALLMELFTVPVKTVKRLGPPQGSALLPEHAILQLAPGCWIEPPCRVLSQTR
jgi:hypothetical protein